MSLEIIVYGGGDKVVDYLNAVASIVHSSPYVAVVFASSLLSLFLIISNYFNTYKLELHKILITIILGYTLLQISVDVVVTDKRDTGVNNAVSNVPIFLAVPLVFAGDITDYLIETFQTAYSTPSGTNIYGYPDKSPMFLPRVLEAHINTTLPDGVYKANLIKYIKRCVAPRITTAGEQALYTASDVMTELYNYVSNIWRINDWCEDDGNGQCGNTVSKTCLEAYNWLNSKRADITNKAIIKTVRANQLPVTANETGLLPDLYKTQLAEAYNRFLGVSGINQATTILNAAITNVLTDGFEAYAVQTGNDPYLLSLAVAQAREADSMNLATWSVIASEKLYFLKEYIYLILIAISPIIFVIAIISGFHRLFLTYFLMLLWISFWDVANVVTEALQYHYLENLKDVIAASGLTGMQYQNITNYAGDVLKVLHRQIVLAGFMSATITPALAGAMVFGLDKLTGVVTSTLGFGQQAATQAGISLARGDISMGNQNILNSSLANDNSFNTSKHTWRSWSYDSSNVNINSASMFSRAGSTEALLNSGSGINLDVTTGMDVSSQVGSILQHSKQAVENAINNFASNKIVRDTFNTAYTHALSRFKNISENNLSNFTHSEIDSYRTAKDFIQKYGYSKNDTYKVAASIETIKNFLRGYNLGANLSLDSKRNILTNLIGKALGFGGSIGAGYSMKDNKIKKGERETTGGHGETVTEDFISNIADYLTHDESFQKQISDQFSKTDGVSTASNTSTAHIFAGSKEFQNLRQKLFQALDAYSKIQSAGDNIRKTSGFNIRETINTKNYALNHGVEIFSRVNEAIDSVKNGSNSIIHLATLKVAKEVFGTDDLDEIKKQVNNHLDALNPENRIATPFEKLTAVNTAQRLLEVSAFGQKIDGKLSENEIAFANFLGHSELIKKQEEMIKNYSFLETQFAEGGRFHSISDKIGAVYEKQIKNKVDSGWTESVLTHETREDKVKKYTMAKKGADKLYKDFDYNVREKNVDDSFDKNMNTLRQKGEQKIKEAKLKERVQEKIDSAIKKSKSVNPELRLVDEKLYDWAKEKLSSLYDEKELKEYYSDQSNINFP